MTEIVKINLENEMDLILVHKRTMKLAELSGMTLIMQTTFATAVSEVARCVIGKEKKSSITLNVDVLKGNKKSIDAVITTNEKFGKEHQAAVRYASRLISDIQVKEEKNTTEVRLRLFVPFSGLINASKIESFIAYFKTELPLSPYDEIRKKNIQLLEFADKLKDSEGQYKSLTETLPLMVFTTNASGFIMYTNKWFKDAVNIPDFQPGKYPWYKLIHGSHHKLIKEEWDKAFAHQESFRSQALLNPKNPGDPPLWHLVSMLPVKNEQNQVVSWTGFFVDIHAQKLIEETLKNNSELKAAQKQLISSQAKLEEKIAELNKSNHDLEQFAYIASHDLQEPLRKIRSFTELLEKNISDPEKTKKYIEKIDSSSQRMSNLIKAVLNYSRLSTSETTFGDVDLQEILNNVKIDMELAIEEKHATITANKLPVIIGIRQQLYQLFYNLVSNSLKFATVDPKITITFSYVSAEEVKQHPDLHISVKYIRILFKDNGIGFEQKHAQQIFTIFRRLNPKGSYDGTGIGL
ncbi:MAG: histidine kinase dimerization/phospho-acceptor domain-containing protein, partial [Bacteroidia bacterium]